MKVFGELRAEDLVALRLVNKRCKELAETFLYCSLDIKYSAHHGGYNQGFFKIREDFQRMIDMSALRYYDHNGFGFWIRQLYFLGSFETETLGYTQAFMAALSIVEEVGTIKPLIIDLVNYAGPEELKLLRRLERSPVVGELAIDVNDLLDTKLEVGPKYTILKILVDNDESSIIRNVKIHKDCHLKKFLLRPGPRADPRVDIPKMLKFFSAPSYIDRLRLRKMDLLFNCKRRVQCPSLSVGKLSLYHCILKYNGPKAEECAPKDIVCDATEVSLRFSSTRFSSTSRSRILLHCPFLFPTNS